MSDLEFVAFSDDGKMIILQGADGTWVEVPIRESQKTYTTPTEMLTGEEISPREIQSRIRAGMSPAELAAATGNSLERIMSYAPPILLERAHVATKATRTVIRRASGSGPLGDTVSGKLERLGVDPAEIEWDSFRREDGRWSVTATFPSETGTRKGTWLFDVRNNALVAADEEARWLIGDPARIQEDLENENTKPTAAVEYLAPVTSIKDRWAESDPHLLVNGQPITQLIESNATDDPAIDELLVELTAETESDLVQPNIEPAEEIETEDLFDNAESNDETASETSEIRPPKIPSWDEILFGPNGD